MATIHIDGKTYEVDGADNLLQACLSLGLDVPYFCWHPALGSVGSCRQCAVIQYNDENDKRGRLVMSCMAPVQDNMWISIEDGEAKQFRESVVEWLMTNHPHDCPVCEEGGHCHLQDMTVMTGHSKRRYRFTKRTHQNQDLGPFVAHEMNRCIACYRCVRYYKDYAGGTDLGVYGAHDNVYFGRVEDGVLESEFSGNLTEVCPTGVFTDKTHSERYNRKWDMQFAPSICHACSVGCNISPGERYGELRRVENRFNGDVNHYFLCDRGRFGYGFVNRSDRPRLVQLDQQTVSIETAFDKVTDRLKARRLVGIGSARASLESNHALRTLVGADNFCTGLTATEQNLLELTLEILQKGPLPTPTLRDIESHDAVFILGEDLTQTAPRIALAVRQAARGKATEIAASMKIQDWHAIAVKNVAQGALHPVFIASTHNTRLDDVAAATQHAAPEDLARLGFAVAHAIDANAPVVGGLSPEVQAQAQAIADALVAARRPLLIAGTSLGSRALLEATANIAQALKNREKAASISLVVPEANSLGLVMLGGKPLESTLASLSNTDGLVVLENDLYRRLDRAIVDEALTKVATLIVLDHQPTETLKKAHLVLPTATFAEADGTLVSQEGRAQRFFQVFDPTFYKPGDQVRESWRWLHGLECALESKDLDWTLLDHVTEACAAEVPALAGIRDAAPNAAFRIKGLKLAREPLRYSGRTAMRAKINVHEPRIPQDQDTAFNFSMEGYSGTQEPRQQIPFAWSPGWNSPQAWNKFQDEVGGHLRAGDPGIRLIAPAGYMPWFEANTAFQPSMGHWMVVPVHHIFGSDELSALAPVVQSRIPEPYALLSRSEASRLGLTDGALVALGHSSHPLTLRLIVSDRLQAGLIGLPVGITGVPVVAGQVIDSIEECVQ